MCPACGALAGFAGYRLGEFPSSWGAVRAESAGLDRLAPAAMSRPVSARAAMTSPLLPTLVQMTDGAERRLAVRPGSSRLPHSRPRAPPWPEDLGAVAWRRMVYEAHGSEQDGSVSSRPATASFRRSRRRLRSASGESTGSRDVEEDHEGNLVPPRRRPAAEEHSPGRRGSDESRPLGWECAPAAHSPISPGAVAEAVFLSDYDASVTGSRGASVGARRGSLAGADAHAGWSANRHQLGSPSARGLAKQSWGVLLEQAKEMTLQARAKRTMKAMSAVKAFGGFNFKSSGTGAPFGAPGPAP